MPWNRVCLRARSCSSPFTLSIPDPRPVTLASFLIAPPKESPNNETMALTALMKVPVPSGLFPLGRLIFTTTPTPVSPVPQKSMLLSHLPKPCSDGRTPQLPKSNPNRAQHCSIPTAGSWLTIPAPGNMRPFPSSSEITDGSRTDLWGSVSGHALFLLLVTSSPSSPFRFPPGPHPRCGAPTSPTMKFSPPGAPIRRCPSSLAPVPSGLDYRCFSCLLSNHGSQ